MSKSIAINAGSSSLKFQLFNMPQEEVVAKGLVERIGLGDSIFSISYGDDQKFEVVEDIPNHEVAVEKLLEQLVALNIICLLYTSPSPRDTERSRMPSSA